MKLVVLLLLICALLQAGVFDGTTSYAASGSSLSFGATYTYCVWIRPTSGGESTAARIVDIDSKLLWRWGGSSPADSLLVNYNSAGTSAALSTTTFPVDSWYFVCTSRADSDGGPRLYWGTATTAVAEVSYGTRADATPDTGSATVYIGNRAANDRTWAGSIAHVSIYATTLTGAQMDMIRRGFEPDRAHLQNYWPLNGDPVSSADPIGGATLTLANVAASATVLPPIARPWAWWASVFVWPWRTINGAWGSIN